MKTFIRFKEVIEYRSNNPYDVVCDALVLDFIKHALNQNSLCQVAKATSSQEVWKTLEVEFGLKECDIKQKIMLQFVEELIEIQLQV